MKSKNTFTVILFYVMTCMLMISIHQNMLNGFGASYPFYMLALMLFLGYTYRRMGETKEPEEGEDSKKDKSNSKFNKKGK